MTLTYVTLDKKTNICYIVPMRIPMQVYFDQETIEFYKAYARQQGKSFAELMRDILKKEKEKMINNVVSKHIETRKKADRYEALKKSIEKLQYKFRKAKYYYPDLTDDELLYGK